jgi:hypothetical protein
MVILSMPQRVRHPRMRPDYGDIVRAVGIDRLPELPCKRCLAARNQLAISTRIGISWPNTAS